MAAEKNITSRIQQKHDTAANWANATTFIPKKGEIVIYDAEYNTSGVQTQAVRFKIGDGSRTINNLPFALIDYDNRITSLENTVEGLGTAAQKDVGFFATAAQGTKADNAVPNTRKVNNKALSADITLYPSDVGVTESAFPGLKKTGTITEIKMNGASKGTSGVVDLGTVLTAHQDISGKLDKTTYEVNKVINFGSTGVLYVGKFKVYDTNVTCEVTSTTSVTYSGKLVIATQNYVIMQMTVYGDAANTVAPNFFIKPSTTSDPYIEIYFKPASWSKNVIHIYGSAIAAEPTNVCTNVSAVPSTATSKPTNALNSKANLSDLPTVNNGTLTIQKNGTDVQTFTANQSSSVTANITVPTKVSELTNDSGFLTSHQDISGLMPKSGGTFTGNISVPKTITFTDNTNPFIKMTTGGTDFYFQSTSGQFGLGPTWNKATHWDSNGNVTFPTVPKVGSTALALVSQIPTFELSGDTLIINF